MHTNPHVPFYLFGVKRLPKHPPPLLGLDDEGMAQWYAVEAAPVWHGAEGALDWFAARLEAEVGDPDAPPPAPLERAKGRRFFLDPEDEASATCPFCDGPAKRSRQAVLLLIEPSHVHVVEVRGRFCDADDLLVVRRAEFDAALAASLHETAPELVGNEYLLLGTVDPALLAGAEGEEVLASGDLIEQFKPFKVVYLDEYDLGWDLEDEEEEDSFADPLILAPAPAIADVPLLLRGPTPR